MSEHFTLIDEGATLELEVELGGGRVGIPEAALRSALGWELRPEGLCRGDVCVPVRDRAKLVREGGVDLEALAELLDRPLALDAEERAAALGTSAAERTVGMASLEAPDFTLPDLAGRMHSLSEHRGKKVLLIAYASW